MNRTTTNATAHRCVVYGTFYWTILRRFSNHSRISSCVRNPRPMRIMAIIATQMRRRIAPLIMAMRRRIPSIAAIIKNIGELINSGISHPFRSGETLNLYLIFSLASSTLSTTVSTLTSSTNGERINDFSARIGSP